ncbi:YcxB family protein [Cohnella cholangitidis]|uniref:YcxB family protein n=1 Tax=Cohnella cholangitidis TaxID=2598458 RepID=A0A7G5C1R6_9BACL|nr:YcxB family protein [Cohnella cholangitidis]QMV43150.1 YcxB family protein [Cohnella cholangitidis]
MIDITYKYNEYMGKAIRGYHHNSLRFWISNVLGLAIVLLEIIMYSQTSNQKLLWIAFFVLLVLGFSYVTSCYLQPAKFMSDARYNKPFTLSVGDEQIRLHSEDLHSDAAWSTVTKVWATDKFYYLFLDKRQFWIIPRDRFADQAQEEQFKQIASRHRKINRGLIR